MTRRNKKRVWSPRRPRPPLDPATTGEPAAARASEEQAPDEAVAGRDRLSENENRPMDPGVSDSSHA
jgi:hypothetical protein